MDEPDTIRAEFDELERTTRRLVGQDVRRTYDMQFDLYKHLTTLSAGTIVILAAFFGRSTGSIHKEGGVFLVLSVLAMILDVVIGYFGMMIVVAIQHSPSRVMHHVFSLTDHLKRKNAEPGSTGTVNEGVKDAGRAIEHAEDMLSATGRLEFAAWLHPRLMSVGSIAFVFGLVMLALFIWQNALV